MAHDRSAIVRLSRSTQDLTPEAFLKDLDLAYGPDPRARVEAVIRSLRHLCLQQGGRGKMHVPCLQAQANFGQVHQDFGMYIEPFMRLPEPHLDALKDLGEIFQPNTEGTALIRSSVLTIELPATLHGVMEALGQVGAPPA